jgi:hypothetical protein
MHTAFLRANVVFFFSITVLFVLSLGCAAQYFTKPADFPCAITEAQVGRLSVEHARIRCYDAEEFCSEC